MENKTIKLSYALISAVVGVIMWFLGRGFELGQTVQKIGSLEENRQEVKEEIKEIRNDVNMIRTQQAVQTSTLSRIEMELKK